MKKPTRLEFAARAARAVFLLVALAALYAVLSGCSAARVAGVPPGLRSSLAAKDVRWQGTSWEPALGSGYEELGLVYTYARHDMVKRTGKWLLLKKAHQELGLDWDVMVYGPMSGPTPSWNGRRYELRVFLRGTVYRELSRSDS